MAHTRMEDTLRASLARPASDRFFATLSLAYEATLARSVSKGLAHRAANALQALRFIDCEFSGNEGIGAEVVGILGATFFGCSGEHNQSSEITDQGNVIDASECGKLEVLSSAFESAAGPTGEFIRLRSCSTAVVDSCTFERGPVEETYPPAQAVNFRNCYFARFSNNLAEGMSDYVVKFDAYCQDCVEFGNRRGDPTTGPPPILIEEGASVIGMSRRALGLRQLDADTDLPTAANVQTGSLAWVDTPSPINSNLRMWDGAWRHIFLTAYGRRVVDLLDQADDVNSTPLFESTDAGMYRVGFYARCDTGGAAGLARVRVRWNDASDRVVEEVLSLQTAGSYVYREIQVFSAAGEDITYEVAREDVLGQPKYSLHVRGEAIQ